jgi:threonine/homoserine/homoserine lactone efflux protein
MLSRTLTNIVMRTGYTLAKRLVWVGRQLWHEITGSIFLFLGLGAAMAAVREWRTDTHFRAILASAFAVLMIYFGVTAFLRARHISRQGAPR